jgi:hypothetical protein
MSVKGYPNLFAHQSEVLSADAVKSVSVSYNPNGVLPDENDDDPGHIGMFFAIVVSFYINMLKLYLN